MPKIRLIRWNRMDTALKKIARRIGTSEAMSIAADHEVKCKLAVLENEIANINAAIEELGHYLDEDEQAYERLRDDISRFESRIRELEAEKVQLITKSTR